MEAITMQIIDEDVPAPDAINQALALLSESKPLGLRPLEGGIMWPEAYPYMLATAYERAAGQALINGHAEVYGALKPLADHYWKRFHLARFTRIMAGRAKAWAEE